jgi:dihydrofolate synthase/folylpolyglutamate synthase
VLLEDFDPIEESIITSKLEALTGLEFFNADFDDFSSWARPIVKKFKNCNSQIVTIAGTNGKGQTAHALAQIIDSQGHTYAMWSSPHILSVRERFQANGKIISYDQLTKYVDHFSGLEGHAPSYYELLLIAFFQWVIDLDVEYVLLEVGLGGRLDGVNVVDCDIAAITSISRDHCSILGNRYDQILFEKLGIARSGKPLITSFCSRYLRGKTAKFTEQAGILWRDLCCFDTSLHQKNVSERNITLAQEIAKELGLSSFCVLKDFGQGRLQQVEHKGNKLLFIGAHNIDGIRTLDKLLKDKAYTAIVSFSMRSEKEIRQMCKILSKIDSIKEIVVTSFIHPKALDEKIICSIAEEFQLTYKRSVLSYFETQSEHKLLIVGSYYFIGYIQREITI